VCRLEERIEEASDDDSNLKMGASISSARSLSSRRLASALKRGRHPEYHDLDDAVKKQTLRILQANTKMVRLACRPSLHAVGAGIFSESTILPGTVVAFFPGLAHLGVPDGKDDEEPVAGWSQEKWIDNDKIMSLPDGGRIDGGAYSDLKHLIANKLAVGHMINHPNANHSPNVLSWNVVLDVDECEKIGIPRNRIPSVLSPTWYFNQRRMVDIPVPSKMMSQIPCIAIVSLLKIEVGDELLLDYNLNSKQEWYFSRDPEKDFEREQRSGESYNSIDTPIASNLTHDTDGSPVTSRSFEATMRGVTVEVSSTSSLRSSLLRAGVSPHNGNAKLINCRGMGTCGTCALMVEEGEVLPQEHTTIERLRLSFPPHGKPASKRLRLACQVRANSDLNLIKFKGFWGQDVAANSRSHESATEFKTYFGELEHAFDSERDKGPFESERRER